jgi:hypothetical protein
VRGTLLERTVARIVFGHPMECWLWQGAVGGRGGYGMVKVGRVDGRQVTTMPHRVMYEAVFGPIPAGLELDHLCEVKTCCNPAHLDLTDHATNMRRWMARSTRVGRSFVRRPGV